MNGVHVRYFAVLREQRGRDEEALSIQPGETVGALYARLFPAGADGALPIMFAVNQQYVAATHVLCSGDEVVFIPPLGGG